MSILRQIVSTLTRMVPLGKREQAVLAEVLSQALAAGMEPGDAFAVAAKTLRGWRMRRNLARQSTRIFRR